jgi:hypothetical protein
MLVGIAPSKELNPTLRYVNEVNFSTSDGMEPVNIWLTGW